MTFESMLVQSATLLHIGSEVDRYNTPRPVVISTETDVPCWVTQLTAEELDIQRTTAGATHRGFFLPDVTLTAFDQVIVDDQFYEVIGPPDEARTQRGLHHLEVLLRTSSDWSYP